MKTVPSPSPTAPTMKAKPTVIPAICGTVRRNPYVSPDDSSMMLFGPGVKNITTAKITKAKRSECDMAASRDLGQVLLRQSLRPLRQQHDGDAADHGDHAGQPQRPKGFAENDAGSRGADERHQQRDRHHLRRRIIPQQPAPQPIGDTGRDAAE